ncbi:MAG TPA: tetratricopeptide repeat protein [Mucilaginibacter sp.]|nr:tetratricopeptide repeat protein [Mucilaginibacter sp.]
MQNITAQYNILFNAKEILRLKQESYAALFVDDYNELLSVYPDTTAQTGDPDKDLEEAIAKANKIINIKEQSRYIGDAYIVIAKANYLEGNYFNATEFFSYVARSFPKRADLTQDALTWKARSLMYQQQLPEAKAAIDSAIANINPKKNKGLIADIYATKLQYDINVQDYADGEAMARLAVEHCHNRMQRLRLRFILSQLLELNGKSAEAITNYARIARSNVSFEMAFNASLNRIRIEDARNGVKTSRTDRLLALLKEPNDKEFKDQIYYQVAELQRADNNIDDAIKNYQLSVRSSVKNQGQKGLSYLRLATIYFKDKADYLSAKKYYDSTLAVLPPNYPGYLTVKKMNANLQLLTDAYQTIAREDTLQALAKMDQKMRDSVIDKMVSDKILKTRADEAAAANPSASNTGSSYGTAIATNNGRNQQGRSGSGNTFYFYNVNAVSQGYNDFKRRWGDRKLEDNWRRSNRSSGNITANTANISATDPDAPVGNQPGAQQKPETAAGYRNDLVSNLPLTPGKLAQSNIKIYHAYVDIANFYRDILNDKKEAITAYQNVLDRFPDDPNKAAIYYNLYRLYSDTDPAKSDKYKNILLKEYASTPFAKIISDPDYARKLDEADAGFTQAYNDIFNLYAQRKYDEVIPHVSEMLKQYPGNKLSAQLHYLKTIAEGHNEKIGPFADSLKQIASDYPDDKLITPLVTQQLTYINANLPEMQERAVVLTDDDPQEIPFTLDRALKEETAYRPTVTPPAVYAQQPQQRIEKPKPVVTEAPKEKPPITPVVEKKPDTAAHQAVVVTPPVQQPVKADTTLTTQPVPDTAVTREASPVVKKPELTPSIFSENDSTNYYIAVNVASGTTNMASTRFGFGQFIRANHPGEGIKHYLLPVGDDNQIVYVGRFYSLNDARKFAREIAPLLPDIVKVPRDKYTFFIITQENLNKLANEKLLDSYLDYYQKNF